MDYFYAIVHKDADSAYGVHFPDVPGCFSAADHLNDLVPNAIEALTLWSDDQPLPAPSDLEDVRQRSLDDLASGAFVVAVPWVMPSGKLTRVNLSIDERTLSFIDQAAERRRQTRSAFLVEAAREMIARQ